MEETTPLPLLYGGEKDGVRGGGGKFRKPPTRKRPATAYVRPPATQVAQRCNGDWFSKFVDPAYRFIADGATKFFPYFLSPSESTPADNDTELTPNAGDDDESALNLGISRSTGGAGPSKDRFKSNSKGDKTSNLSDDYEFFKIEQMMKGQRFSRDEANRLTEILNSRVVSISDVERENKQPNVNSGGDERPLLANEQSRIPIEIKQEDTDRAVLDTSMLLLQSNVRDEVGAEILQVRDEVGAEILQVRDEVGASPVDIARAYMGSRTSEVDLGGYSAMSKDARVLRESALSFVPSPSHKSSPCWPGAVVQDRRGYLSPQNQSGRFGIQNFPRTPYSRTIFSKSKAKLTQADTRSQNISSTPVQQFPTPLYGRSRRNVLDDGYGSVGPMRHKRNTFSSETPRRGSIFLYPSQTVSPQFEKSRDSKGFLPAIEKNLEPGETSGTAKYQSVDQMVYCSEEGVSTSNPPVSEAVRKILEHLDRHTPTPKEKAAELKLATAWKKASSDEVNDGLPNENIKLLHLVGIDSGKNRGLIDQLSAEGNDNKAKPHNEVNPQKRSNYEASNDVDESSRASGTVIGDAKSVPFLGFNNTRESQIRSACEKAFVGTDDSPDETTQISLFANRVNGSDFTIVPTAAGSVLPKKPPSHPLSAKPNLAFMSINKPDPRLAVSSDNGPGFTFPVSTSSSDVLSEPPTPSIVPSFSANGLPLTKAIPCYSFGTKKSTSSLIFSFPSTNSASNHDDASGLKFNFGSDKKNRISFTSISKDPICY